MAPERPAATLSRAHTPKEIPHNREVTIFAQINICLSFVKKSYHNVVFLSGGMAVASSGRAPDTTAGGTRRPLFAAVGSAGYSDRQFRRSGSTLSSESSSSAARNFNKSRTGILRRR